MSTPHGSFATWIARTAATVALAALAALSWRTAQADWLASSGTPESTRRAVAIEPDNATYRLRLAQLEEATDPDDAQRQLREAVHINPTFSQAWMAMGLQAEAAGKKQEAEQLLLKAAALDRQFKPAWTLANFYVRTGETAKLWPRLAYAVDVTTQPGLGYFDIAPMLDLAKAAGADSKTLQSLLPHRDTVYKYYFFYLLGEQQPQQAMEVFDAALRAADPASEGERWQFARFDEMLYRSGKTTESAAVWNRLVEQHLIASTLLHPEKGEGIANPDFSQPFEPAPFGWRLPERNLTATVWSPGSVWFEFNGQQPESVEMLTKNLAVLPNRDYSVTWRAVSEGLTLAPTQDGLKLLFLADGKQLEAKCSAFLAQTGSGCTFRTNGDTSALRMMLIYERQPGTVRLRGGMRLTGFNMSFAPPATR